MVKFNKFLAKDLFDYSSVSLLEYLVSNEIPLEKINIGDSNYLMKYLNITNEESYQILDFKKQYDNCEISNKISLAKPCDFSNNFV